MRSSELRNRVTLQSPIELEDGMGGVTASWKDEGRVWAAIWPVSAAETVRQGQQAVMGSYRVRMRYHSTLATDWRIKHGDIYYSINGIVNPNMKNEILDLVCKEAEVE